MGARILAVDDEEGILRLLKRVLERDGNVVDTVSDPAQLLNGEKGTGQYDLILLDVMMPGIDGFTLLEMMRDEIDCPVLFLTAKTAEEDLMKGFGLGADDYIRKPFRPRELLSRIRSVLRRSGRLQTQLVCGPVRLDTTRGIVTKNGVEVALSALEYRLLLALFANRGVTLTRERLLGEIWDAAGEFVNDNTLTVYIKRLREKLEDDPQYPSIIRTVRGVGYRMEP